MCTVIFRRIDSFKSISICSTHFPFFFSISFNITTVSRLSIPPALFHLLTWPLISCFLLSILTQDWCALVRRCLLKNWQSAWLGTDFSVLRPFCTHPAQGKMTDKLFDCLPSEIRSSLWLQTVSDLLFHTEYWLKPYTWCITASYVTFEICQDMSRSMNSLCEYGSSLLNVQR